MPLTATTYTPEFRAPAGGSSDLQFYFTVDQHTAWLAATDQTGVGTAGWYRPFRDLAGGTLTPEYETNQIFNEAGERIAETTTREEYVLAQVVQNHNAVVVNTLKWMRGTSFPARYTLPPKADGTFKDDAGDRVGMLYGIPAARVVQTGGTPTGRGEQRATAVEIRATKPEGGGDVYVVADVNIDDETAWPARMSPYKNVPA